MTVEFREDTFKDNIAYLLPYFVLHMKECGNPGGPEKVNVDIDSYMHLERSNYLKCFSAKVDGLIVGYISGVIGVDPHCKDSVSYTTDTVYLHPDYRKGTTGVKLIKYAERVMKEKYNVDYFSIDWSLGNPNTGRLLDKLGYTRSSVLSTKKL